MTIWELWIKPNSELVIVEWNACRCHENDVCMTWGSKFGQAGWYGTQNKSAWNKQLKKCGWQRLDRKVVS
jgi:hypothetical protein